DDANDVEFGFTGEILEAAPHSKIVHTQVYDPGTVGGSMGDGASIITVTLDEADGQTHVTTVNKFASKADRHAAVDTGMTDGMEMSYKQLDEVLEEEKPHAANV